MKPIKETKKYFCFDTSSIKEMLRGTEIWNRSSDRQASVPVFRQTQSLVLLYDLETPFSFIQPYHSENEMIFEALIPTLKEIEKSLAYPGYWFRILLARMPANSAIPEHIDQGWNLSLSQRFHWVIETNPKVEFMVDHHRFHLAESEVWQINNRKLHSVRNLGETSRIHMIADFLPAPGPFLEVPSAFPTGSKELHYFELLQRAGSRLKKGYF